jgi:hypothetical protein
MKKLTIIAAMTAVSGLGGAPAVASSERGEEGT